MGTRLESTLLYSAGIFGGAALVMLIIALTFHQVAWTVHSYPSYHDFDGIWHRRSEIAGLFMLIFMAIGLFSFIAAAASLLFRINGRQP